MSPELIHELVRDGLIFAAYMLSMLLKDIVYTIETKADANGNVMVAAIADPLGDGLASLTNLFTIGIVAAGLSRGGDIAQIAGNMAGGFVGVVVGNRVSNVLDALIEGYHRRPSNTKLAVAVAESH